MGAFLIFVASLTLCASAHAQSGSDWRGPFAGTVAGAPAVALLRTEGDRVVSGLYFYRRLGRDIAIEPDGAPGRFKECGATESLPAEECDEPTGRWEVKLAGPKLTGTWRPPMGGPGKPIELALLAGAGDPPLAYDRMRYEDNRIAVVREERRGPVTWNVVREARTGATGRVLTAGGTEAARRRINADLQAVFHESIGNRLTGAKAAIEKDTVVFANERLFAVTREHHVWGGAHPSMGFVALTWDLETGEAVDWSKRLRFEDPAAKELDLSRQDLVLAQALRLMMPPPKGGTPKDEDGCLDIVFDRLGCDAKRCTFKGPGTDSSPWRVPVAWPLAAGLSVGIDLYNEAERGCRGSAVVIPWSRLQRTRLDARALP